MTANATSVSTTSTIVTTTLEKAASSSNTDNIIIMSTVIPIVGILFIIGIFLLVRRFYPKRAPISHILEMNELQSDDDSSLLVPAAFITNHGAPSSFRDCLYLLMN